MKKIFGKLKKIKNKVSILLIAVLSLGALTPFAVSTTTSKAENHSLKFNNKQEYVETVSKVDLKVDEKTSKETEKSLDDFFESDDFNVSFEHSFEDSQSKNGTKKVLHSLDETKKDEYKTFVKGKSKEYLSEIKNDKFELKDLVGLAAKSGNSLEDQIEDINKLSELKSQKTSQIERHGIITDLKEREKLNPDQMLEKLRGAAIGSGAFTAAAAALAAAYWAGAWFFGITIPSAIAATTQAVVLGVQGAVLGTAYEIIKNIYYEDRYNISKGFNDFVLTKNLIWLPTLQTYGLIKSFLGFIQAIKSIIGTAQIACMIANGTIFSTSWAAPIGLGFIALSTLVLGITGIVLTLM